MTRKVANQSHISPAATDIRIEISQPDLRSQQARATARENVDNTTLSKDYQSMIRSLDLTNLSPKPPKAAQSIAAPEQAYTFKAAIPNAVPSTERNNAVDKQAAESYFPIVETLNLHKSETHDRLLNTLTGLVPYLHYLLPASRQSEILARFHRPTLQRQLECQTLKLSLLGAWLRRCVGEVCAPQRDQLVLATVEMENRLTGCESELTTTPQKASDIEGLNFDEQHTEEFCNCWRRVLDTLVKDVLEYKTKQQR